MKRMVLTVVASFLASVALAQQPAPPAEGVAAKPAHAGHAPPACADPRPECSATATPAFARDGKLWLAFAVGRTVYAASSRDNGKSFAPATAVFAAPDGVVDSNGEARPKIVPLADGSLLVSYTTRPDKVMMGTVFLARSTDGGKSFSPPQPLLSEGGQRFETFVVAPKGRVYAAWLDKTNLLKAKAEGRPFAGSGVAFGWSDNGGASFEGKKILMDHACECCRVFGALDRDGLPVFVWRHVFDGEVRDHYAAKLSADGARLAGGRVSDDDWAVNSCPHHGPSLTIDAAGAWHVVWFTKGKKRSGLFYAASRDGGKSFSEPEKFGDDARAPSHAAVLAAKGRLHRVWKEFDGEATTIAAQVSADGGKNWSAPRAVAATADASDHPLLIERKGAVYLSWLTRKEGYRLIALPREAAKSAALDRKRP
jgi:hypothetical protein